MSQAGLGRPSTDNLNERQYDMLTGKDTSKTGRRVKRDGALLRSKDEICRNYDASVMPYPIKNLI